MADIKPILIALSIVFIIGFLLPICLIGFLPQQYDEVTPYINTLGNKTDSRLLNSQIPSFFMAQVAVFKYLPPAVSIPLLIVVLVCFTYAIAEIVGAFT